MARPGTPRAHSSPSKNAFSPTRRSAPRLDPATAAQLLGAEQARLQAQLDADTATADAISEITGSGLRLDQAAAAYAALTTDRRAAVMAGPAGSGKTRTVAEMTYIATAGGDGRGDRPGDLADRP